MSGSGTAGGGAPPGQGADGSDDGGRDNKKILLLVVGALVGIPVVLVLVVILAAVVGSFVLGLGGGAEAAPTMNMDYEYQPAADSLTVTHAGGDTLEAGSVEVVVNGQPVGTWAQFGGPGDVTVGDSMRVPNVDDGDTVQLVWTGGSDDQVISSYSPG